MRRNCWNRNSPSISPSCDHHQATREVDIGIMTGEVDEELVVEGAEALEKMLTRPRIDTLAVV
jgi:hypothetical protein